MDADSTRRDNHGFDIHRETRLLNNKVLTTHFENRTSLSSNASLRATLDFDK